MKALRRSEYKVGEGWTVREPLLPLREDGHEQDCARVTFTEGMDMLMACDCVKAEPLQNEST